jgi:hypothetical protein
MGKGGGRPKKLLTKQVSVRCAAGLFCVYEHEAPPFPLSNDFICTLVCARAGRSLFSAAS